jgi:hypothetical protein
MLRRASRSWMCWVTIAIEDVRRRMFYLTFASWCRICPPVTCREKLSHPCTSHELHSANIYQYTHTHIHT